MPSIKFEHHTQFFTSTIFEWKHLLKEDAHKQIIIESLLFLKKEGSIVVNAFVPIAIGLLHIKAGEGK